MTETHTHTAGCCDQLFSWDNDKNRVNRKKHKLSFELASLIFHDPAILTEFNRTTHGEDRYQSIGLIRHTLLFVIHSQREQDNEKTIRIISARKATTRERAAYVRQVGR